MSGNSEFTSLKNYMKRDLSTGTTAMAAPSVLKYGSVYTTTLTIPHNLGIVPFFELYYEPFKNGIIWEAGLGTRSQSSVVNPSNPAGASGPYLVGYADTSNLTIELGYGGSTLTGTYTVYYVIYKDYGLV